MVIAFSFFDTPLVFLAWLGWLGAGLSSWMGFSKIEYWVPKELLVTLQ